MRLDQTVAPQLQAARADLERARLQDNLEKKIDARPDAGSLVEHNILKGI
jgi:hypothetical protein